jgi:hypothetical protein
VLYNVDPLRQAYWKKVTVLTRSINFKPCQVVRTHCTCQFLNVAVNVTLKLILTLFEWVSPYSIMFSVHFKLNNNMASKNLIHVSPEIDDKLTRQINSVTLIASTIHMIQVSFLTLRNTSTKAH